MNRKYFIIGGSSDVGVALIKKVNDSESNIHILAHYHSSCEKIEEIIPKNSNSIETIQCDLRDEQCLNAMIESILKSGAPNSIIHLAAPKYEFIRFKDLKWENCLDDFDVQVRSVYKVLQAFIPEMTKYETRSKVVIMLSENTVKDTAKFTTKYTLSKYLLLGLVKSLSAEYKDNNININALSPAMIDTKLLSHIDKRMLEAFGNVTKMLTPDEVADSLLELLSDQSDQLYGENIHLSGGVL